MSRDTRVFFMFAVGLVTVMFGVGGVEHSITDTELLQSIGVAVTGLGILWCSTLMMRAEQ